MARKPRIYYEGAFYHVIVRGNNKDYVFQQDYLKEEYLSILKRYTEKYDASVYAYVIMDNHVHILIEVEETPLSKIMQLIQQTYTSWYNRKNKRTGHVFEQRYKSLLVDKDSYLSSLVRYIHQNPIRAGVGDINYEYSSHIEYIDGIRGICKTAYLLNVISDNEKKQLIKYQEFMDIPDTEIVKKDPYHLSPRLEDIKSKVNEILVDKIPYEDIVNDVEKKHGINNDDLKGGRKRGFIKDLRDEFVIEVLTYKALSQVSLGEILKVSPYTISRIWCNKV